MANFDNPFRNSAPALVILMAFCILASCSLLPQTRQPRIELPDSRWEPIFFRSINRTTEVGGLEELRKIGLTGDDIEVRVWRGFGLQNLEGVILKRAKNQWRAFHVRANDHSEPSLVEVKQLPPPISGWDSFWQNVTELGLLTLRDPSEKGCEDSGLDGTSYVVEINRNQTYRTYQMRESGKCEGVRQMENIDDVIGKEFDSGSEQCKTAEWFPCAKLRKSYRQY